MSNEAKQAAQTAAASAIVPTVGRMVYFKTRGSADGIYPPTNFAAIITEVQPISKAEGNRQQVHLVCFGRDGIRFEHFVPQGEEPGCWDWMPFQKDQQARLAPSYTDKNLVYYGPHPCAKCDPDGKKGTMIVKAGNGAPDDLEFDYPKDKDMGIIYPNDRPDWIWKKHEHVA